MKYEAKAWKEKEGASLRSFNEKAQIDSVNGALALRPQIEKIIDKIWEDGFDGIYFMGIGGTYASSLQVEVYMRGKSKLPIYVENAAEFLTTGNRRFTDKSVVIYSSVSGTTKEMIQLVDKVHEIGARVFAFIDTPGSVLTQPDKQDFLITYKANEQLKFFMTANYLMYLNGEFEDYEEYNKEMETYLADALAQVEKDSDEWAYEYAKKKVAFLREHPDLPHYFIGSGNQYGATYSYAMCYWEEQMWIRTKSISCQEFFHGMQEIVVSDTPITLFIGEDEQRPLAERVARFLPKVNANYTIIDTREQELKGISPKFRGSISHLVMHGVNNRVDAYMELFLRHPLSIRRYYNQMDY
jgi:fructoselysine-6-phosphate deglycase